MKKIMLSGKLGYGKYTIVDDEDYYKYGELKWSYNKGYAEGWYNGKKQRLHRVIMNAKKGEFVDHIHHDTLDNRKSQMRICTFAQNVKNSKPRPFKSSKYKGVSFCKRDNVWKMGIKCNGKEIKQSFSCEIAAAYSYNKHALIIHGDFAFLNKLDFCSIDYLESLLVKHKLSLQKISDRIRDTKGKFTKF